jgi:gliding motility-associated-like protein
MKTKNIFLLSFCGLIKLSVFSQLTVTTNSSATALAQNIVGTGVTVSNAKINCDGQGSGTFTYSGTTLGITGGILLTTGYASDASGTAQVLSEFTGNDFEDPNLVAIEANDTFDVCILTFDFIPLCNQVSITYEFGSSEYDGYQCSAFNDIFGLFLTGPNPAGGNYAAVNIATLPNGNIVSINNINDGKDKCKGVSHNPTYYIDNSSGQDIAYEGLTTAITSVKPVVPCSTYTMKIAIADAGDEDYDSGVFIKGNSVTCQNTPTVTASATPFTCTNPGSATATVTNYTGTITYQWEPGGATTATINNLSPGTYTCSVSLQSGCAITPQTVTAVVSNTGSTFSYTTATQNPLCNNGTNGTATVTAAGGVAPYTYSWSTTPAQTTTSASNLAAGNYVITVKDNTGCIGTTSVTLTNPAAIVATMATAPTTCTASIGSATATVNSGGTAPYNYTWSTMPAQTTQTINNLAQGSYTVSITDANTCTATATGVVSTQSFAWSPSASATNPSCAGSSNGSATVSITNPGTSTFTYSWTTTPPQINAVATNLPAGNYTIFVTDNNGCISKASAILNNPPPIPATINTNPTICTGSVGSATAAITSGGTAPYTYTWSPSGGNAATAGNLAQGSYSVAITDANGCMASATGSVSSTGFTWAAAASSTNPTCIGSSNGTATLSISNPGTSSFTYSWTTTPVQTNSVATSLSANSYTVSITDNNGCVSSSSVTLTNPPPITATVNTNPTICTGSTGSATVSVLSGGTAPYTYTWLTNPTQAGQSISNLPQGVYSAFITDVNHCQSQAIFSGTVSSTPASWNAVADQTPATCFGKANGTATVSIANAPAGTTYTCTGWSTSPVQTGTLATGLSAGNYTATIQDNNDCIGKAFVTVTQPYPIVLTTETSSAICTTNNGTAIVFASGGTSPYAAAWQTNPPQLTLTATNLAAGSYTVTVHDADVTCIATTTVMVKDTADLTVTASQSPDLCNQGVGKAIANPKGEAPYIYLWTTTPTYTTQIADSLKIGTYSVTVVDAYGCKSSASTTVINDNDILSAEFSTSPPGPVYAENVTTLQLTTNSGWVIDTGTAYLSNGIPIKSNPFNYTFPQYGDYTATYYFTSSHGCKDTVTYTIVVSDYMTLYIPNAFTPNGDGRNDVFAAEGTFINTFEMYIYDRWGILVTKLDNINKVWDGTKNGGGAQEDIYVYKGDASDIFGKHITFQGQISLVR